MDLDLILPRLIAAVVHAIAQRDDRGLEYAEVVFHAAGKSRRRFAAPSELEHPQVFHAGAGQQTAGNRLEQLIADGVPCWMTDITDLRWAEVDTLEDLEVARALVKSGALEGG